MRVETTRDDINMGNSTRSVFDAGSNKMCLHSTKHIWFRKMGSREKHTVSTYN
jgi:hypothetical protein